MSFTWVTYGGRSMGERLRLGAELTQKTAVSPKPTPAGVTAHKAWTGFSETLSHSL